LTVNSEKQIKNHNSFIYRTLPEILLQ